MNNISLIESVPARATQVFGNKALNDQIPLLLLDNELGTDKRTPVNCPA
jgi:hypothetical protein